MTIIAAYSWSLGIISAFRNHAEYACRNIFKSLHAITYSMDQAIFRPKGLSYWDTSCGGPGFVTFHFDLTFVTAGLCKIVGCLQAKPMIGVRPTGFFQSDRHIGGDAGMSIQHPGQSVAGDAEHSRRLGNA
jgi:hypothetical protein